LKSSIFKDTREVLAVESEYCGQEYVTVADVNQKLIHRHGPKLLCDGVASEVVSVEEKSGDKDSEGDSVLE